MPGTVLEARDKKTEKNACPSGDLHSTECRKTYNKINQFCGNERRKDKAQEGDRDGRLPY